MDTAAKIYEEGEKVNKDVVQVNPAWVLEESLKSLSSKFPILPRSQGSLTFCTTPLSSKLESKPEDALFDLADTNVLRYNVLHDSHLKDYFQNPETRRRLVEQGFITEDGYVICNLVEFNNYRKWIRRLKLEELYKQRRHIREEEINQRNTQLMAKKLEREKECSHILREREQKAKEYRKKKKEKRDLERKKYSRLQEIEMRRREKKRKERRDQLDDVEEERKRRQVERQVEKIIREDKKRKIRLRIVRKRKQEDTRRDAALKERRHLGRCQRDKELKKQWKRRCTIALGHITEKWKNENQLLELRERNIERRAKMYQKRQTNSQESVINFVKTRRATLHQEFLEAEEFLNKLRMRKDIEIANWKRKHERMLSRGSSITSVQHKESRIEGLDEYMALRRWSAPNRTGFRRRLKSTWDLKSSLIKDLEEESPSLEREKDDPTREKERMEELSKTDVRVKVRSLINNIINSAHNVFEEEKKRTAVKSLVGGIIDSAVAVVDKEETNKRNRTYVRRYVFSVIEAASQTLEKERREAVKAKMMEEEAVLRVKEQMNRIAAELVSAAMVFAKRRVDKDVEEKATEDDEELKDTAKWIVGTAIERALIRFKGQVQDISRVSSESLPESIAVDMEEVDVDDSRLDWAVRNIVSDAVATAVDSMECLYYKECDLMEAAMGLMNSAMINAQESLENMHRVTPALEEQINRTAWRLANRALISAENALEKQREESIEQATQELTSHAILSAQNSFARMEEQMLCETAEELALQAIMKAQKSLRKSEEEELFSQELATRAIMEAKESLVRADEIERTSRELARQAIELAQVSSQNISKDRADEAKKIAVAAAERCIEAYKSQENLTPEDDLVAAEALKLAIQAINSAEGSLEEVHPRTTCVLTDGKLLSGVMQYVEGIIVRALQELESNKDINVLKPGNIQPDEYNALSQSDTSLHRKSFVKDGTSFAVPKESETAKAATSSRRRSSVHFNATNIFSNRKDSLSRDSDHLKARNRPPTPRFLAQRSFTNQLACASWDNLEEKLKHIEKKDRVKVLLSTREGSPTFSERKRLHLRRFSSDQSIAMKRRPVVVSFQIPHSSSDNSFRRASDVQDSQLVKEMIDSSNEGEDDLLDTKEHRECEFDTLVSMTNTPEPQAFKGSEDDILQTITSDEERIPCQITPRASSYILLPKLELKDQVLLQAKVIELEQIQRCVESSSTHLPAVSPTTSLVMVEDADSLSHTENETKTLPTQKHTNLPKISKSRSLVSIEREAVTKDFDHERVTKVSEDKSEAQATSVKPSQTEGPLVLKPSNEVASVPLNDVVMEVSPKTSFETSKMSPRLSSQSMKRAPTEAIKVSPKQSREAPEVLPKNSSDSTKMINIPSTQTYPAPSSESLSPRPSKKRIAPITSTESARVSPKLSIKTTTDLPKASSEYIQTEKTSSAEAGIISPKPSSDGLRELIESNHSMKETQDSVTEAAILSPKPSGESSKLSPKSLSDSQKVTQVPSTEAKTLSPKSSIAKTDMAEKDESAETEITAPKISTVECKVPKEPTIEANELSREPSKKSVILTPSTEAAEVSSKLSREAAKISPKASSKSAKITPVSSTDAAELPSKTSRKDVRVSPKVSTESTKMVVSSTEGTRISPKVSTETAKFLLEASESAKIRPSLSGEEAAVSPKTSIDGAELLPKALSETKKMAPVTSAEAAKIYSKTPTEDTLLKKDFSESKMVASTTSTEVHKLSFSTEAAKLLPEVSKQSLTSTSLTETVEVSPKASSTSAKITPTPSTVIAELPSKSSGKDVKVLTKDSREFSKVAAIPSSEETRVSPKPSSEAATVIPKASSKSAKITPTPSTVIAELPSKSSGKEVKVLTKDSSVSTKMAAIPSSEKTQVSPKPSSEAATVLPKASSKSAKITPTPSTVIAELPSKSSGKEVKVLTKDSSVSTKMAAIPSSEKTQVSPKPSSEAATVLPKASSKSAKITPTPSTVIAELPSKSSGKDVKVLTKDSRESSKVAAIPSSEKTQVSPKPSSEAARVSPKTSSNSAKITPPPSTVIAELPPKSSNWDVKVSQKDFSGSTKMAAVFSSEKTQVSPKPSSEATKLTSKSSSESAKIKQTTSVEKTKGFSKTLIEDTETTKMTPALSTEAAILSPKSTSSEVIKPSPKASKIISTTTSNEVANVASKLSSDSVIKSKRTKQVFSGKVSSEASSEQDKLFPKASSESPKMTHMASVEDVKVTSKPSSEVKKLLPTSTSGSTRMTHRKLTSRSLAEVTPKPSSEATKLPKRSSSVSTKMTSEPSIESVKMSKKSSIVKTELSSSDSTRSKPSTEAKVSTKPSVEVKDLLSKASGLSTNSTPKPSTDVMKVSPKPSSEAGRLSSQTSQLSTKMTSMESKETMKLSPKPSINSTKLSSGTSSTSTKMVPSPPSKDKVSRKPSREASKLSTKTSTASTKTMSEASSEPAKVSSKHSGDAGILTPKASSVSTKRTASKASSTFSKIAPTSSTDTTQVSAKHSTKSIKLSKKTSSGSTKATSTPSTEVKASPKPSQVESSKTKMIEHETGEAITKSSTQITSPSQQVPHEHQKLTSRASKGDSKLSLKRSRESSILSSKASRESHKKKHKHHKTAPKKVSGETLKLTHKPSSQSTEMSPEVSPRASQVSQMSSMATKDLVSEGSDVSSKTSRETIKDVTGGKMTSIESGENVASESVERIAQTPSRKASKAKHTSQSLIKVSSKTQSQDSKASVSASVVSTYAIETPVPATKVDSVPMDNVSTYSSKSLNKLQTQGSSYEDKRGSQEKLPEISDSRLSDSQSQLSYKDRPHEEGNRRISLSVPDPVVALKGVGRRTSLPGGAFSENEFERRRLSSLHDISESRESNEASSIDDSSRQNEDHSLDDNQKSVIDALTFTDAENRRLSLMRSVPSITIQEPASPPNDDNILFEEDERVRIICELEHTHPVSLDEQISIDNSASGKAPSNQGSDEAIQKTSDLEKEDMDSFKQSKSSIPDIHNENVSDVIKVHQPSEDIASPSQTGSETPKRQSVTCIGIEFSPTSSKDHIPPNRASEVSLKTRIAKGSISKIGQEGTGVREPLSGSFELKGIGLGGERRSSSRALISSRSTEFPRTRPFQVSRGHFSSHSLDTPLSRGVIVTPLKPSPPLSPRLIESSTRRSRLKMALSQQRAKETQSETSLTSSKSDPGEASPKKGSETLLGSHPPANNSSASNESTKTLPERPSTASGMLKREKIKASRAVISSSSSERSDTSARDASDGNVNREA